MNIVQSAISVLVVTFLFCAMLCGFIALSKDRSWLGFALIGLLLGPFGLIVTGAAEPGGAAAREPNAEPPVDIVHGDRHPAE